MTVKQLINNFAVFALATFATSNHVGDFDIINIFWFIVINNASNS